MALAAEAGIAPADVEMVEVYPLTRHFQVRLRRWKPPRDDENRWTGRQRASG